MKLSPLKRSFIEEMGNIYANYGLKQLYGLIVGLLLTESKPLSLDEMVEALDRSKGPISDAARELVFRGIIKKVSGPENRRDYYTTEPDIFYNNFKFNMLTVTKNRQTAESFLDQLERYPQDDTDSLRENLGQMKKFYTLMEEFYNNFSFEWEKAKKKS